MKKITIIFTCVMFLFSMTACAGKAKPPKQALTEAEIISLLSAQGDDDEWDYTQDFSDLDSVNSDFQTFYLTEFLGSILEEEVSDTPSDSAHFVKTNDGLVRAGDIDGAAGMANYALLFFKKQRYVNFKMQVDLKQGDVTGYYMSFNIRTEETGKIFFADGLGFYFETDGTLKTWGQGMHGGPYILGKVDGYNQSNFITYTITAVGNYMMIEILGAKIICLMPSDFYRHGYVSFFSINNNSAIRNFKIKQLPESRALTSDFPAVEPIPDAGTEDSLDSLGEVR